MLGNSTNETQCKFWFSFVGLDTHRQTHTHSVALRVLGFTTKSFPELLSQKVKQASASAETEENITGSESQ